MPPAYPALHEGLKKILTEDILNVENYALETEINKIVKIVIARDEKTSELKSKSSKVVKLIDRLDSMYEFVLVAQNAYAEYKRSKDAYTTFRNNLLKDIENGLYTANRGDTRKET